MVEYEGYKTFEDYFSILQRKRLFYVMECNERSGKLPIVKKREKKPNYGILGEKEVIFFYEVNNRNGFVEKMKTELNRYGDEDFGAFPSCHPEVGHAKNFIGEPGNN